MISTLFQKFRVRYVIELLKYVNHKHPSFLFLVILTFLTTMLELIAMAFLVPITSLALNGKIDASSRLGLILASFSIPASVKILFSIFIVLLLIRVLLGFVSQVAGAYLGRTIVWDISTEAFDHFLKKYSIPAIEEKGIGHFISLAGDEANRAGQTIAALNQAFTYFLLTFFYFLALTMISVVITYFVLAFTLVTVIFYFFLFKKTVKLGEIQTIQSRNANTIFIDSLNGLRNVRALSAETYASNKYTSLLGIYKTTCFKLDVLTIMAKTAPIALIVTTAFIGLVFFFHLLPQQNFSIIFVLIAFLIRFLAAAGQCLTITLKILSDSRSGKDVVSILSSNVNLEIEQQKNSILDKIQTIEFINLSFSYPGKKNIIDNINFKMEAGFSYAFVGPSGSGKSTLFDLLVRFHKQNSGKILINGQEIDSFATNSIRDKIVLIHQQQTIFFDSIKENITFGKKVSESEFLGVTSNALVNEFAESLVEKYNHKLSYQGGNLSGGQRQRIGLARGLIKKPEVLILDESTNALDSISREKVLANFKNILKDKILILITHEEAVAAQCDKVIKITN